jgi:hypothetical protein
MTMLERAREPRAATPMRGPRSDLGSPELDSAGCRPVEAGDDVDERRLAGAVRADQADNLVTLQLKVHAVQRAHALEGAGNCGRPE